MGSCALIKSSIYYHYNNAELYVVSLCLWLTATEITSVNTYIDEIA